MKMRNRSGVVSTCLILNNVSAPTAAQEIFYPNKTITLNALTFPEEESALTRVSRSAYPATYQGSSTSRCETCLVLEPQIMLRPSPLKAALFH